jgi:hypothetical protein
LTEKRLLLAAFSKPLIRCADCLEASTVGCFRRFLTHLAPGFLVKPGRGNHPGKLLAVSYKLLAQYLMSRSFSDEKHEFPSSKKANS